MGPRPGKVPVLTSVEETPNVLSNAWLNGAHLASGTGAPAHAVSTETGATVQLTAYAGDACGIRANDASFMAHKPWAVRPLDPPGSGEG